MIDLICRLRPIFQLNAVYEYHTEGFLMTLTASEIIFRVTGKSAYLRFYKIFR